MFRIGGGEGAWRLIVPLVVKNANGKKIRTYALLDGGSTRHVVAKSICEKLGIVGEAVKMRVTTLDRVVESERLMADVDVEGVNGVALKLNGAIFGNIIAAEDDAPPKDDDIAGMDHLDGVSFPRFPPRQSGGEEEEEASVGVIIGAEHAREWMTGERRVGPSGLPVGIETSLGWGLLGPKHLFNSRFSCHYASFQRQQDDIVCDLETVFSRGFEPVEEEAEALSVEDKFALRQM